MLYSLEHEYLTNNYIRDFNASIIGYLVVLLSILFAEDLRQIIFGLIIIFFIPITISIITYLKIYYFKNSTKIKSSFQFKSKNELPQVDREIEHQARAYEGIPLLIYSLGGIMYFLQSLLFPNLIGLGPAPYNFSGSMVHSLIILSFSILSVTGYRMIDGTLKHDYSKVKYRKDFNNSITGYLVILPVILFAIDLGLILFGLSVIFFIPVLISVFSFLKIKSFDNSFIVRSPFHIERKNKIHKVEQEIEKFDDHTSGR